MTYRRQATWVRVPQGDAFLIADFSLSFIRFLTNTRLIHSGLISSDSAYEAIMTYFFIMHCDLGKMVVRRNRILGRVYHGRNTFLERDGMVSGGKLLLPDLAS